MTELEKKVAGLGQKQSEWRARVEEFAHTKAEWEEEKMQLQRSCVDPYEEGFMKAMHKAVLFVPDLELTRFGIDKNVVNGNLVDD